MAPPDITPARVGRERGCAQCGSLFRSPRSARYCSNACRMKAKRGTKPQSSGNSPTFTLIGNLLIRLSMAGPISKDAFGLTVPRPYAFAEVSQIFEQNRWGYLTEGEFAAALAADGFKPFSSDSPETSFRKSQAARSRAA